MEILPKTITTFQHRWDMNIAKWYEHGNVLASFHHVVKGYSEIVGEPLCEIAEVLHAQGILRLPLLTKKLEGPTRNHLWEDLFGLPVSAWLVRAHSPQSLDALMSMKRFERYAWLQDCKTKRISFEGIPNERRNELRSQKIFVATTTTIKARELPSKHGKHDWKYVS